MKCTVCGVELKDTDKFCGICGTPNPNYGADIQPEYSEKAIDTNVTVISETENTENAENTRADDSLSENRAPIGEITDADPLENYTGQSTEEPAEINENKEEPNDGKTEQNVPAEETVRLIPPQREGFYNNGFAPPPYNAPASGYNQMNESGRNKQKEKRVCSLSAVVFCIVVILILSVACGVLGGMYLRERNHRLGNEYGRDHTTYSYSERID